ncbi:MAG TPA: tyrosine-protein phosphatase [Acidimicrobiia bacterium]|nr:tyrosine-protein phosphatase [Acidimicrobiia bacterium]
MTRWIELDGPANVRDLGGLPVDGGTITPRRAIRADNLAGLAADDIDALADVTDVIDLRTIGETETGITELAGHGAAYHHLPVGLRLGAIAALGGSRPMDEAYLRMFEASATTLVASLEILAGADGAVAYHCAGGKDRTGILTATLLSVLGASDETIASDYALTQGRMPRVLARLLGIPAYVDVLEHVDDATLGATPETMFGFLRLVRGHHGSFERFLLDAGLEPATIERLRTRLIETT